MIKDFQHARILTDTAKYRSFTDEILFPYYTTNPSRYVLVKQKDG